MRSEEPSARSGAVLAACAALLAPAAIGQEPALRYAEGAFLILAPPEYPESSLKAGEVGTVEVAGRVKVDGSFEKPTITANPPSLAFEFAVNKVLPYWRVQPRLEGCRLVEADQRVMVWFEIEAGNPKVSYSQPVKPRMDPAVREELLKSNAHTIIGKVPVAYPRRLLRNRNTPDHVRQTAYLAVGGDGSVESVAVLPMRYYASFQEEMVYALSQWKFRAEGKPFCVEVPMDFKITD